MTASKHENLWAALVAARAEYDPLVKDKSVNAGKFSYTYADLASLLEAVTPALCKHGVVIYQAPTVLGDGIVLVSKLVHGDTGESVQDMLPLPGNADMQKLGSAISYARRYLLMAQLGVAAEDDDGKAASSADNGKAAQRTTQTRQTQQRPQKQTTEATGQPTDEDCDKFMIWARKQNSDGGPCTEDQYKYLAGIINGITGQTTHKDVLKLLLARDVSSENVPSYAVTGKLLEWLPSELGSAREKTKRVNENYKPQYAACIRKLHEMVMKNSGQQKLMEEEEK